MRTMRSLALGAMVLAGAAMASPAARAHGGSAAEHRGHSRHCSWIPARWETRVERVMVRAGSWRVEVVPAVTRTVLDLRSWRLVRVVVTPAKTRRVRVPPRWAERRVRVLRPGRWACAGPRGC